MATHGTNDEDTRTFDLIRRLRTSGLTPEQRARLAAAKADHVDRHASILIVDDSAALRSVMTLMLRELGYENLAEAEDGRAALDLLGRRDFDLIVLDIEMPRLDGFGVLAALQARRDRRGPAVIVASGIDRLDAVVRCIELGAEDFLPKPVHAVLLRARLNATLERRRLHEVDRLRLLELQAEKELVAAETESSERLLLNILPLPIAERLKQGATTIAERHPGVTILFADLAGFTEFSHHTDPGALVTWLNALFSRFDRLTAQHGLEKIKTIGDIYLAVCGLPEAHPDHAERAAGMALDMLPALGDVNRELGTQFALRIGLNSGPVVAGVIGRRKFTYDLWGTAVNLASRLQSTCPPNGIHVSRETFALLRDKHRFTQRGEIDCKGVGRVLTYLLDRVAGPGR